MLGYPAGIARLDSDMWKAQHLDDEDAMQGEHKYATDEEESGDDSSYLDEDEEECYEREEEEYDDSLVKTTISPAVSGLAAVNASPGDKIWCPHPELLWQVGIVLSVPKDKKTVKVQCAASTNDNERYEKVFKANEIFEYDETHEINMHDMAAMNDLHEPALLELLRMRYLGDQIYTCSGDVVISVNPFRPVKGLYDLSRNSLATFRNMPDEPNQQQQIQEQEQELPAQSPHLFTVAERAYRGLMYNGANQTLIVNGISAAGKTEACKHLLRYLTERSQERGEDIDCVEYTQATTANATVGVGGVGSPAQLLSSATSTSKKSRRPKTNDAGTLVGAAVLHSNPILEAFGNAKTIRNSNSSRFGKMVQLDFDKHGVISGCATRHFLLEKSRVVSHAQGERSYHIFYQLCAGHLSPSERTLFRIPDFNSNNNSTTGAPTFTMLNPGAKVRFDMDGKNDKAMFRETKLALEQLGIDRTEQDELFMIVSAVLWLGNVTFEICERAAAKHVDASRITDESREVALVNVCALLGMEADVLERGLCERTIATRISKEKRVSMDNQVCGQGAIAKADESTTIPLTPEAATQNRDALAKALYAALFDWLVQRINRGTTSINSNSNSKNKSKRKQAGNVTATVTPQRKQLSGKFHTPNGTVTEDVDESNDQNNSNNNNSITNIDKVINNASASRTKKKNTHKNRNRAASSDSKNNSGNKSHSHGQGFIGILDIFGFENLKKNSLEQLCVGYANLILQQQFAHHIFVLEQQRYVEEGIDWTALEFHDHASLVDTLSRPGDGIFQLLEEQGRLGARGSDASFLTQLHSVHADNQFVTKSKFGGQHEFLIKHFAGEVVYQVQGMVNRNNDSLHRDLAELVSSPSAMGNQFVLSLFNGKNKNSNSEMGYSSNSAKKNMEGKDRQRMAALQTLTFRFRADMKDLVKLVSETQPSFVRCVKPNHFKHPLMWDARLVTQQLRYLGVMDTVRIRREGFPVRQEFAYIAHKYQRLLTQPHDTGVMWVSGVNDVEACEAILVQALGEDSKGRDWQRGKSQVFLGNLVLSKLNQVVRALEVEDLSQMSEGERQRLLEAEAKEQADTEERIRNELGVVHQKQMDEMEEQRVAELTEARKRHELERKAREKLEGERNQLLEESEMQRTQMLAQNETERLARMEVENQMRDLQENTVQRLENDMVKLGLDKESERLQVVESLARERELRAQAEQTVAELRAKEEERKAEVMARHERQRREREHEQQHEDEQMLQHAHRNAARVVVGMSLQRLWRGRRTRAHMQAVALRRSMFTDTLFANEAVALSSVVAHVSDSAFVQRAKRSALGSSMAAVTGGRRHNNNMSVSPTVPPMPPTMSTMVTPPPKVGARGSVRLTGGSVHSNSTPSSGPRLGFSSSNNNMRNYPTPPRVGGWGTKGVSPSPPSTLLKTRRRRHLVLTTSPGARLLVLDILSNDIKVEIKLDAPGSRGIIGAWTTSESEFVVRCCANEDDVEMDLRFIDLLIPSSVWVDTLMSFTSNGGGLMSECGVSMRELVKDGYNNALGLGLGVVLERVVKCGMLTKRAVRNPRTGGWRDRMFVLTNSRLMWFKYDADVQPRGALSIDTHTHVRMLNREEETRMHCVEVVTLALPQGFRFKCKSSRSGLDWTKTIRMLVSDAEEEKRRIAVELQSLLYHVDPRNEDVFDAKAFERRWIALGELAQAGFKSGGTGNGGSSGGVDLSSKLERVVGAYAA